MQKTAIRLPFIVALVYQLLMVSGCISTPPQNTPLENNSFEQQLAQLYERAKSSDKQASGGYRVEAANLLSQQQRLTEAATILEGIDPALLTPGAQATYALIQAEIALSKFDGESALQLLNQQAELIHQQGQAAFIRASKIRATSYDLLDRPLDSARERIHLTPFLPPLETETNELAIWSSLIKTPLSELQEAESKSQVAEEKGWLSLAVIAQTNKANLDQQLQALQNWLTRWPTHPAALNLPKELALLDRMISERPNNIALMLPLTGKNAIAGKAIRDGFMAAYYQARAAGDKIPQVRVINTADHSNFIELYQQTALAGADFIIGPLEKQSVQSLLQNRALTIPTLALNYSNLEFDSAQPTPNLYQFGLSAEDEARQTAHKAWQEGHTTCLVLTPGNGWGQRIADAFAKEWETLGGTLLESSHFDKEKSYSKAIEELFDIDDSNKRARRINQLLSQNTEFTARRRNDVDFIFIVATPKQGRQIKPTLAFHFASNIPVFATSHIYSGSVSPLLDRDLDDVVFTETPWLLSYQNDPLKQSIDKNWPNTANRFGRLYALGVDAFQLFPRIQLLSTSQENMLAGATGLLTLDDSGRVVRTLEWAHISQGHIKPLTP